MLVAVSSWFSISSLEGAAGAAAGCGGPEPIKTFIQERQMSLYLVRVFCCWKRLKLSAVSKRSTRGTAAAVVQVSIASSHAQGVRKCDS